MILIDLTLSRGDLTCEHHIMCGVQQTDTRTVQHIRKSTAITIALHTRNNNAQAEGLKTHAQQSRFRNLFA